jgi:NAD(P)-dependent dehydrogenase (short-subunit alcohol dehydrogenase family)
MLQAVNGNGTDVGPATAIESRVRSGAFRGLIDLRYKALPDLAEQLGALAVFICSDAAAQLNGVALPVDGGWLAR